MSTTALVGWTPYLLTWALVVLIVVAVVRFNGWFRWVRWVAYLYFWRVPFVVSVGIGVFCFAAFSETSTVGLLLHSAFDVHPYWRLALVSFFASLAATSVGVSRRIVELHGGERFFVKVPPYADEITSETTTVPDARRFWSWPARRLLLVPYLLAFVLVVAAIYVSTNPADPSEAPSALDVLRASLWAVLGFLAYGIFLVIATVLQVLLTRRNFAPDHPALLLPFLSPYLGRFERSNLAGGGATKIGELASRLPPPLGVGYVRYPTERKPALVLPGHGLAIVLLVLTLGVYFLVGFVDESRLRAYERPLVPVLCYVLLLFTMSCWLLSGLTYFFDRYRIPVLLPLVALLLATSYWPGLATDYFYETKDPVASREKSEPYDDSIVVVASNGGGIQAAAWTARVLTGLEEECRERCDSRFAEAVSLISSVSGGSIGTMYFVNEYDGDGSIPRQDLDDIVARAEESSLDHIGWGLLYPDLSRTLFPYEPEWNRGLALQRAWLSAGAEQGTEVDGIGRRLSRWRAYAQRGNRPAVIFNATVAETGEPVALSTTDLSADKEIDARMLTHRELLSPTEDETDLTVVTAARLSAGFPYISPAARADVDAEAASHVVDGGYYDNYGVSSLVDWLDWKLEEEPNVERVLIVQIIGQPAGGNPSNGGYDSDRKSPRGWIYQATAPAATALNVRKAGQRKHSQVELRLLREKWDEDERDIDIQTAVFDFNGTSPPLSWHLTGKQKQDIEMHWQAELCKDGEEGSAWQTVQRFLGEAANESECTK